MINAFIESVSERITRAYLKSLYTDASLNSLFSKISASIISCERPRLGTLLFSGEDL
jgi:hypothetical protein